ncbi:hypothetical protein EOL70_16625 [Leucothrix sargassi]|nr:hypothetical protein EOL70_16625 [Leucothrix sargassi]
MSIKKKSFVLGADEAVSTNTLAAVFSISIVMGLVAVSGVLMKPYEATEVVENLHQRILLEKEMREFRRMGYGEQLVAHHNGTDAIQSAPVRVAQRTERAEEFEREVRSEEYWASLQDSVRGDAPVTPGSTPVVIPPVVLGAAE